MKYLKKIEKGSDNRSFDWLLESEFHSCDSMDNSAMIRVMVYRHNQMIDYIKQLEEKLNVTVRP
jgi:hypothetical protein